MQALPQIHFLLHQMDVQLGEFPIRGTCVGGSNSFCPEWRHHFGAHTKKQKNIKR